MQVAVEDVQVLSQYVRQARAGEEVVFTLGGHAVAQMVSLSHESSAVNHSEAVDRLMEMMRTGYDLGGLHIDRDELYDRGR